MVLLMDIVMTNGMALQEKETIQFSIVSIKNNHEQPRAIEKTPDHAGFVPSLALQPATDQMPSAFAVEYASQSWKARGTCTDI